MNGIWHMAPGFCKISGLVRFCKTGGSALHAQHSGVPNFFTFYPPIPPVYSISHIKSTF